MSQRVIVLGGGVAGMSAAHELVERGFHVEVYERKSLPGGKARSLSVNEPQVDRGGPAARAPSGVAAGRSPRGWLPGEHGFRFFPRFYRHVVDTMQRIPFGTGNVAGNLVDTTRVQVARFGLPPILLPARFPRAPGDLEVALATALGLLSGNLGIPLDEAGFFAGKMWQLLSSCEERRSSEYERVNWWDFIEAAPRSAAYQKYFGNGITRSLVAAKARRASTKTIGNIFLQIVFDILTPGISADRVLNGPTNDVWINPWLDYLERRGVVYHRDAEVRGIDCAGGRVRSARVLLAGREQQVKGDYFVAALPVERMAGLVSPAMLALDPSLKNLEPLTAYVEWMNGIQFYLTEDVPIAHGHSIYVDSPWALTSVSQPQFWRGYDLSEYGDGRVRGVLSVDISNWDVAGLNGKQARDCSREEVASEVWEQLKRSLNVGGERILRDEQLHYWFLDPDIVDSDPNHPGLETNVEPLLVNYVDTWRLRPEAVTRIPNLFLASDYVRTHTDLATMEAANEAARRAVNGVLAEARSDQVPCGVYKLHEPEAFMPLRAYDRLRFRQGLPWDGAAIELAHSALALGARAGPSAQPDLAAGRVAAPPAPVGDARALVDAGRGSASENASASAARAAANAGLSRIRILPE